MTLLLDTSVFIKLAEGLPISAAASAALLAADQRDDIAVSVISAWEVGLLATRTGRSASLFKGDARLWFRRALAISRFQLIGLDVECLLAAAYLPGEFHRDPSDRMIVAQSRQKDLVLVTDDRKILAYAEAGHVRALAA